MRLIDTYAVGVINDISLTVLVSTITWVTKSNSHGIEILLRRLWDLLSLKGFSFTQIVDFDALYGHRVDAHGYRMIACMSFERFKLKLSQI